MDMRRKQYFPKKKKQQFRATQMHTINTYKTVSNPVASVYCDSLSNKCQIMTAMLGALAAIKAKLGISCRYKY